MSPETVAALMFLGIASYLAGLLKERNARLKELQTLLAQTHLEKRAFENQLLVKQGNPPIFKENGVIVLDHIPEDVSAFQILKPPFAQAAIDWEREEQENKAPTLTSLVPPLTEEQKAAMSEKYKEN